MKKLLFFAFCTLLFSTKSNAIPPNWPKWVKQIFGCTYDPVPFKKCDPIPNHLGYCSCSYTYINGTSWLWGGCPDLVIPGVFEECETFRGRDKMQQDIDNANNIKIAEFYTGRILIDNNVNPLWTNPVNFNDSNILLDAVKYRMQLAGYIWNDSWLQLSSDPCPIPVSTQPTLLPQANTYISDGQCGQSITVTPNPSNGIFTVDFTNLALNVNTLDIINLSTQGIVFTTNTVSFPMQISIPQIIGQYCIRIYTSNGIYSKIILIQ